jgi:hypothetical protein
MSKQSLQKASHPLQIEAKHNTTLKNQLWHCMGIMKHRFDNSFNCGINSLLLFNPFLY